MPATRQEWARIVESEATRCRIADCRGYYAKGDRASYDATKRGLAMACYMCTFDANTGADPKKPKTEGRWRTQKAARLNGLVMHDFDHLAGKGLTPREVFDAIPQHWFDDKTCPTAVLLAHTTPSGDGLRLVTIAKDGLDIEGNQAMVAMMLKQLNPRFEALEADGSCINADRGSFMVGQDSILYINDAIFSYDNPEYDKKFGDFYRQGRVAGRTKHKPAPADDHRPQVAAKAEPAAAEGESYPTTYHGVEYAKILDTWFQQNGGEPEPGDRHKVMLRLVSDLRYICNNSAPFMRSVLIGRQFIRQWVERDGAGQELDDMMAGAVGRELWWGTPKRLKAVLDAVGLDADVKKSSVMTDEQEMQAFRSFQLRLEPLLTEPYSSACSGEAPENHLAAIMASGAMFCTLMTRCWYEHYDGQPTRLNPSVFVIGPPASGKSFVKRLDDAIMSAMRTADAPGRKAEKEYKRKQKERSTSSKAQKSEPLEQPTEMIRYLPSKTSNAVFFRRAENAKEVIDGDIMHLHLYMFDSELDSSVTAQSGGAWIGKHDLELKAFHNEFSGVDYANTDSVNDIIQVFWNQVITGTLISLQKKINMRNINDGLCTRLGIVKMFPAKYSMMARGNRTANSEAHTHLREWGYRFDGMKGELKIGRLVDHCYDLCAEYARQAGEQQDDVLDLLRKRAVYYAIWLTIPRIYGRQWEHYRETGEVEVDDDDLQFAAIIYEAVIYWQDYFFGRMLSDSWQNAELELQQRKRNSQANAEYSSLPQVFHSKDMASTLDITDNTARARIARWLRQGYIVKVGTTRPATYRKVVKDIIV